MAITVDANTRVVVRCGQGSWTVVIREGDDDYAELREQGLGFGDARRAGVALAEQMGISCYQLLPTGQEAWIGGIRKRS